MNGVMIPCHEKGQGCAGSQNILGNGQVEGVLKNKLQQLPHFLHVRE